MQTHTHFCLGRSRERVWGADLPLWRESQHQHSLVSLLQELVDHHKILFLTHHLSPLVSFLQMQEHITLIMPIKRQYMYVYLLQCLEAVDFQHLHSWVPFRPLTPFSILRHPCHCIQLWTLLSTLETLLLRTFFLQVALHLSFEAPNLQENMNFSSTCSQY